MCRWIMDEVGPETPLHFSRFYPLYQLKRLPPTPLSTLQRARDLALSAGLSYVYIGNVPGHEAWNTFCPRCEKMIIERIGYMIKDNRVIEGKCQYCGKPIAGIWV
jgi:pyruvate formate lyase activating enzyme